MKGCLPARWTAGQALPHQAGQLAVRPVVVEGEHLVARAELVGHDAAAVAGGGMP